MPYAEIVLNQSAFKISPTASERQGAIYGYSSTEIVIDEVVIAFRVLPSGDLPVDSGLNSWVLKPIYASLRSPGVGLVSPVLLYFVQ
jgi:hypothetical protein